MSDELYIKFLEKCLGKSPDECLTMALTGGEIVEAIWLLNDKFRPYLHRISTLCYDSKFEKEADEAIEALVFNDNNWGSISAQAWRVLLERHQQAITFFQLQANEPFVPIVEGLHSKHYGNAVLLFVLHQWKLPYPIADRSNLIASENTIPGSLKQH